MVVSLYKSGCGKGFASAISGMMKLKCCDGMPRWSSTIEQCNLIDQCRDRGGVVTRILVKLKIKEKYPSKSVCLLKFPGLLDMMFKEAKRRAQNVHIYDVLVAARAYRGRKTLERHRQLKNLEWSLKKEFDECIILWHVATDICYDKDQSKQSEREVSLKVSNYMIYLLIRQSSMLQLGYGKTRFETTSADVKKKLKKGQTASQLLNENSGENVNAEADDSSTGNSAVSLLHDCCRLAKELQKLDQKIQWPLICEIWMEMLGYAAIHCDSYQHAKSLSRGGELITHLWLLMAHLGVVEEHKIQQFQSASL